MKLLDLCCGAGGCSKGYEQAGFDNITGIDIQPHYNYPYKFVQVDAVLYLQLLIDRDIDEEYDLIHASPPCQTYSWAARKHEKHQYYDDLLERIRSLLKESGCHYVIENVVGAPLIDPIFLEGGMFGLGVVRRRLFECSFDIEQPSVPKRYGSVKRGQLCTPVGHGGDGINNYLIWAQSMGIDWMTKEQLTQAIPPAYTRYIGQQFIEFVNRTQEPIIDSEIGVWKL